MDAWVVGLVAISAVLHLAWNVRLKTAGDPLRAATIGMVAATFAIVPIGVGAWLLGAQPAIPTWGIVLGLASGLVEAAYFILLAAAYRRGDLSVVYPVARGTAPLLAVAVGVLVFGERLGVAGSIGVVALLVGYLCAAAPLARDRGSSFIRGCPGGRGRQRDPLRPRDRGDDRHVHGDRPPRLA